MKTKFSNLTVQNCILSYHKQDTLKLIFDRSYYVCNWNADI